jgi:hypothetical protein
VDIMSPPEAAAAGAVWANAEEINILTPDNLWK